MEEFQIASVQIAKQAGGSDLSPALFFERYNVVGRTVKNITQLFQREQGDVLILFQRVQSLVVNAGLQQLILRYMTCLHRLPKRPIVDNLNHPALALLHSSIGRFSVNQYCGDCHNILQ